MKVYLVVSQPRSGSTLLQKLLNGHTKVIAPTEPWIFYAIHDLFFGDRPYSKFLSNYVGEKKIDMARNIMIELISKSELKNGEVFIEKTPRNIEILDFIESLGIEIRYILLRRNRFGIINSQMRRGLSFKSILKSRVLFKINGYIEEYRNYEKKLNSFFDKNRSKCINVNYEDLVADPKSEMSRIQKWMGLEIEDLTTYENETIEMGDRKSLGFNLPHIESQVAWKHQLTFFEKWLIRFKTRDV